MAASYSGHVECVDVLLDLGADVTLTEQHSKFTAIHKAVAAGSADCVIKLLEFRHPQNVIHPIDLFKDREGNLPIHYACYYGYADIAKVLLDTEDNVKNSKNNKGRTPVHMAAYTGQLECLDLLINGHGAKREMWWIISSIHLFN